MGQQAGELDLPDGLTDCARKEGYTGDLSNLHREARRLKVALDKVPVTSEGAWGHAIRVLTWLKHNYTKGLRFSSSGNQSADIVAF